jgi:hypothetical protein
VLPQVAEFLKSFSDIRTQKRSSELLKLVCCAVEILCAAKGKRYKIDKKQLVVEIYDIVFIEDPLTPAEKVELGERIEFLHSEHLIKGVSHLRWLKKNAIALLFKKD